jgi:trehalose/maltose hydrolase-like predicted phosphorylase
VIPEATFEALVFDWDGTAVPDRESDASGIRDRVEALSLAGVHLFIVTGTNVGNVDGQLHARPAGPGSLWMCCNRGSEVFEVTTAGPTLTFRRTATPPEDAALSEAARLTVERLGALGLEAKVVSARLNRRKIDLIPVDAWADPKKAAIARLADAVQTRLGAAGIANLAEVVHLAADASKAAGLVDPRITSDVKHVEIGLTDKSDSARFAASWLAERGIAGGLVLIGGDEFGPIGGVAGSDSLMMVDELQRAVVVSVGVEPGGAPANVAHLNGGPNRFLELMDMQLARRTAHRVPAIDLDPAWVVPLPVAHESERVAESLGALTNGAVGTRGSREEDGRGTSPLLLVNGLYADNDELLAGPNWTGLNVPPDRGHAGQRFVDLRTATLVRLADTNSQLRSLRFVSAALPHAMAFRAEAPGPLASEGPVELPPDPGEFEQGDRAEASLARVIATSGAIALAARDSIRMQGGTHTVERLAAWVAGRPDEARLDDAYDQLADITSLGFDRLLADHRSEWARRWADAEVAIEGDPESELAARFAVFHLLGAAPDTAEAAVGARGLTGDAYGGHVFWDADVFVLPALAAIRPAAARAILEYRIRRLPAARTAARAAGLRGARFPWESAADGSDVTPRSARGPGGELVAIATGPHEQHIVADVAWAAAHYATWSGDSEFLSGPGRDLLVETARFWADRIRSDADGHGHIDQVMGPDEYHEIVDDNAYTNVMARWNLRRAAELLDPAEAAEANAWRSLAETLVDGWSSERGLYEQFAGYFDLEPLVMSEVATPPVAADVLLGSARVAGSQLIKQVDVLMLHHLVPDQVQEGSLGPCLAFYEPRTAHGSSLSPAVSASLLAQAGEPDRALELFRVASRLDLDDLTGTTAGGLHLATMGGVWQALAFGFLGLRATPSTLEIRPCLPSAWRALGLRFRFEGRRVVVRAAHDEVRVVSEGPLLVRIANRLHRCGPRGIAVPLVPRGEGADAP